MRYPPVPTENPVFDSVPIDETAFKARAILLGERLDLRAWRPAGTLAANPLTAAVEGGGAVCLYRYGVAVFFGVHAAREAAFLNQLDPFIYNPYVEPETEELEVRIEAADRGSSLVGGVALLPDAGIERLQVLADVLSKSVLLSLYERRIAGDFDRIEPLAAQLGRSGRVPRHSRELLKMIGAMLLVEQRMVGRAEIADKPEVLWENPALEALYAKVEDEFEITARHSALERKLKLISQTAETVVQLLSSKHSLRVEWYILALIVVEILLTVYELFVRSFIY